MKALTVLLAVLVMAATAYAATTTTPPAAPQPAPTPAPSATAAPVAELATPAPLAEPAPVAEPASAAELATPAPEAQTEPEAALAEATPAPLAPETQAEIERALTEAQAALAQVNTPEAQAEIEAALADARAAQADGANAPVVSREAIKEAIAAATEAGTAQCMNMEALAPTIAQACQMYATGGATTAEETAAQVTAQLDSVKAELEQLQASGELSADGAKRLSELIEQLVAQHKPVQVYSLAAPLAQLFPSQPQGVQVYTLPEAQALELKEKLELMPELKGELQKLNIDNGQLADELKTLGQTEGLYGGLGQELDADKLKQELGSVYQLQAGTPVDGATTLFNVAPGQADELKAYTVLAPGAGKGLLNIVGADGNARVLIVKLNDDGTLDVSGPGYSAEELDAIRMQLQNVGGLVELLKQHTQSEPSN